jgi:hypothetical protein
VGVLSLHTHRLAAKYCEFVMMMMIPVELWRLVWRVSGLSGRRLVGVVSVAAVGVARGACARSDFYLIDRV